MARGNVRVTIDADASGVKRGTREAEVSLNRFGRAGSRTMGALKVGALGAGAALGGGLVVGLKQSVDAAIEAQKSQAKLQAQLKATGVSYKAHAKEIDEVIQKTSRLSGLDDEDLQDSFTNIVRSTHNVSEGLRLTGLAADIARAKHMDVANAGQLVAKVYNGNVGALKRLGIAFAPVTDAQDKLKESTKHATVEQVRAAKEADKVASRQAAIAALQRTFSGQAESYGKTTAGAMDRFRVASENLKEKIGTALLPTITKVANKLATFVTQMTDGTGAGGRFAAKLKEIADRIVPIIKFFSQHPQLIAVAVGAWVTYRVAALAALAVTRLKLIAQFAGLSGPAAKGGATAGIAWRTAFLGAATVGLAAAIAKIIYEVKHQQHWGDQITDLAKRKAQGEVPKGKGIPFGGARRPTAKASMVRHPRAPAVPVSHYIPNPEGDIDLQTHWAEIMAGSEYIDVSDVLYTGRRTRGSKAAQEGGGTLQQSIDAMAAELRRQNDFAVSVANITGREAVRALAGVMSGEIVGFGYAPRAASAGSGVGARY